MDGTTIFSLFLAFVAIVLASVALYRSLQVKEETCIEYEDNKYCLVARDDGTVELTGGELKIGERMYGGEKESLLDKASDALGTVQALTDLL